MAEDDCGPQNALEQSQPGKGKTATTFLEKAASEEGLLRQTMVKLCRVHRWQTVAPVLSWKRWFTPYPKNSCRNRKDGHLWAGPAPCKEVCKQGTGQGANCCRGDIVYFCVGISVLQVILITSRWAWTSECQGTGGGGGQDGWSVGRQTGWSRQTRWCRSLSASMEHGAGTGRPRRWHSGFQ